MPGEAGEFKDRRVSTRFCSLRGMLIRRQRNTSSLIGGETFSPLPSGGVA
jgi:hypothetical protein